MNTTRCSTILVALGLSVLMLSCQSPQKAAPPKTPPASPAALATEPVSGKTFSGSVAHVDAANKLLSVKSTSDQKDFTVARGTKVVTETAAGGTLATLNAGDLVEVEYEQHGASATATRIVRKAVAAGEKSAPSVERLEKMLNPDPNNPYKTE